ncbi:MAG TPA: carbohydrate binding family 9 domain-containing protein [Armatimonadota bacterium]|nr:carbohydrate binding family 9 domain-containing protein [Armatimonadota bacterium]
MRARPICFLTADFIAAGLALLLAWAAWGEEARPRVELATGPEIIQAVKVNTGPVIDGMLDDDCWKVASKVNGFEYLGKVPLVETVAYFCCGEEKLYIAFDCKDDRPEEIRAQQKKRGGSIWNDDLVEVDLDCMHDHRSFYEFAVNALGTQWNSVPGGTASKIEWRGDWKVGTKVNTDGWCAEIEIPFSVLRYPREQSTFGLVLYRRFARAQEWYTYPRMGEVWDARKAIDWTGLVTPVIKRGFIYMPYALAGTGDGSRFTSGMDIKRTFDNNVVTALTIRPDFETIEQVVDSVDFSYLPRSLPDNRPFFTEGHSYFSDEKLLTSRNVETIDVGGKVFGKVGAHQFGLLSFFDVNELGGAYLSYDWQPSREFDAGAHIFNCHAPGVDATVAKAVTGISRLYSSGGTSLSANYYRSFDRATLRDGYVYNLYCDLWRAPGHLEGFVGYEDRAPTFSSPLGYINLIGSRSMWGQVSYYDRYDTGPIRSWSSALVTGFTRWYGGSLYNRSIQLSGSILLRNRTSGNVSYLLDSRPPNKDKVWSLGCGWRGQDLYRSGGVSADWGKRDGADYSFISLDQGFKLGERWSARLATELLRMDYPDALGKDDVDRSLTRLTASYDITPEKSLYLSLRALEGDANVFLAYRQELRRGTDIFFIWGDPNAPSTKSRLSLKLLHVL